MKYISIRIDKWNGTTASGAPCKSQTEIDNYIDSYNLNVIVSLSYYDFDDYEEPIKYYIDTKFSFNLISGFTNMADIYVQQNHAEQSDSIFQFQPSVIENNFINVETFVSNLYRQNGDGMIFQFNLIKDSKSVTYQRSVLTFLDWCGFIGGVNEILHLAGMLIVSSVSDKFLYLVFYLFYIK